MERGKSLTRQTSLTENEKTLTSKSEIAETLNNFFSNIVKKFEIPKFDANDLVTTNIKDPVFKGVLKYKHHQNVLATQKYSKKKVFHFKEVNMGEVEKEILKLDKTKASQKSDIATWIIKENIDIFAEFLCTSINSAIKSASFNTNLLKKMLADIICLLEYKWQYKSQCSWVYITSKRY